jgi:hypothetical protein
MSPKLIISVSVGAIRRKQIGQGAHFLGVPDNLASLVTLEREERVERLGWLAWPLVAVVWWHCEGQSIRAM